MKYLLIFPPVWSPTNPYLSVPTLLGQLEEKGFDASAIDLNVVFYSDILTKEYLLKSVNNIKTIAPQVFKQAEKYDTAKNNLKSYSFDIQALLHKKNCIGLYFENKIKLLEIIPNQVENAVSSIKNPKEFYNPESFVEANNTINEALEIVSLSYAPAKVSFLEYENPLLELNYENVKLNVLSSSTNIFLDYFDKWISVIKDGMYDYVGISVASHSQIIPALTLSYLLKKRTNIHVNLGGNFLSRIEDGLIKQPEFFDLFADSVSIGEGEKSILRLAEYINGQIPIENVPNLIYKNQDKVVKNKSEMPIMIDDAALPSYTGYDFSKYISPDIALPIQTTKGCYWGKCSFCSISYGKTYCKKNVNALINQIKKYKQDYNIRYFCIVDESIHPKHLEKIADKIIENDLNISYYCPLRTEKFITKKLLEKFAKSGLKLAQWGLESGSKRIFNLINKGNDINQRLLVLKESSMAGIWNHAFIFFCFPTETFDEAKETLEYICNNDDVIDSIATGRFTLAKYSMIANNPEKYGVMGIDSEKYDFSPYIAYKAKSMNQTEYNSILNMQEEKLGQTYGKALWRYSYLHYLFLFISHYGVNWIKNYKVKNDLIFYKII